MTIIRLALCKKTDAVKREEYLLLAGSAVSPNIL